MGEYVRATINTAKQTLTIWHQADADADWRLLKTRQFRLKESACEVLPAFRRNRTRCRDYGQVGRALEEKTREVNMRFDALAKRRDEPKTNLAKQHLTKKPLTRFRVFGGTLSRELLNLQ